MIYQINPPEELIEEGRICLPPSKSMLNRALLLNALRGAEAGESAPFCGEEGERTATLSDDVRVMSEALALLSRSADAPCEINLGESGTALRFLTAYAACCPGIDVTLTGAEGLSRRPVGLLVDALRSCGASVEYLGREGYAPLRVKGAILRGGELRVDATVSSQFISALMMVAPLMSAPLTIAFEGEPASLPYIKMTAEMMRRRGVAVEMNPLSVAVTGGSYRPVAEKIEGDWSAAAFWYEVVALTAGWINLVNLPLPSDSIQGDAAAARFFEMLGVLTDPSEEEEGAIALSPSPEVFGRLDLDLNDYPDLAPPLTVTCCMLGVPFRFVGLKALGIKESDRLQALVEEMERIGCTLEKIRDFGLEWDGKRHPMVTMPVFDPRGDHRLAMAFAPAATYIPGILVRDAECVSKSYPGYWDALRSLGFFVEEYRPAEAETENPEEEK